jgi:hypothetical protein
MTQKTLFTRKGKTITDVTTGKTTGYKYVNEAKRASAQLQKANGGIGRGSLKLIKK